MGSAVVLLFFLPWLDRSPVKSIRYRPFFHKVFYGIFVAAFLTLGFLGTRPPSARRDADCTDLRTGLLRVLPWHAVLDKAWQVQAAA